MANNSEQIGDDREQRLAELKRKMQEAARKAKTEHQEAATPAAAPAVAVAAPVAVAAAESSPVAPAVAVADVVHTANGEGNGAVTAAVAPAATAVTAPITPPPPRPAAPARPAPQAAEETAADSGAATMNRREFLTYAWGAASLLLAAESGLATYFFMYPRFRAGEFGGKFVKPTAEFGAPDVGPNPEPVGKFWMVTTQEGKPKAIYMVCTHLGCLYKWAPSNNRFECPCHGSKFSHDGFYIEGPAPRSLDYFTITEENGQIIVDTGDKKVGDPSAQSPARAVKT